MYGQYLQQYGSTPKSQTQEEKFYYQNPECQLISGLLTKDTGQSSDSSQNYYV